MPFRLCRQNICLFVFCIHIDHTDLERYGYTALMLAAQGAWFPVVERLLQEERIDLDKVGGYCILDKVGMISLTGSLCGSLRLLLALSYVFMWSLLSV